MAKDKSFDRLGKASVGSLLWEFSAPSIVSMIVVASYNVIDAAFLGQAFPDGSGVAVTTLALPVTMLIQAFSVIAGIGGNALASLQLGEGDISKVERTLGNTTTLLFIMTALLMILSTVFIDPLLVLIGTTDELWDSAKSFIQIISILSVFQIVGFGVQNFARTAGYPMFSLATNVASTVACIALNYLFVLVLNWGVAGSAWATVLGTTFLFVPSFWFFTLNKKAPFKLRLRCLKLVPRTAGRILVMGLASFAMQIASTIVTTVFNQVVGHHAANDPLGVTGALAAIGVAQRACYFAFTPIMGLMMAAQPIVGYNYGAKKWTRVTKILKWACIDGAIAGTIFFLLFRLFPGQVVDFFGVSGDLREFAMWSLQVYSVWYTFVGYQAVSSGYFQSSGQPIKSTILELSRQVIFLIPAYLFLPDLLAGWFGITPLEGVTLCVPISDMCATILTTFFVIREALKLKKLRATEVFDDEQNKTVRDRS